MAIKGSKFSGFHLANPVDWLVILSTEQGNPQDWRIVHERLKPREPLVSHYFIKIVVCVFHFQVYTKSFFSLGVYGVDRNKTEHYLLKLQ